MIEIDSDIQNAIRKGTTAGFYIGAAAGCYFGFDLGEYINHHSQFLKDSPALARFAFDGLSTLVTGTVGSLVGMIVGGLTGLEVNQISYNRSLRKSNP